MLNLYYIVFYISIICGAYGVTYEKVGPEQLPSSNPTLAEEKLFLSVLGSGDPDEGATCGELIESRGFKYERYYVTTEDGYILQNYRIVNPYARKCQKCLKPVLLAHALFYSCSCWLLNSPYGHIKPWDGCNPPDDDSGSLGYLLANKGYDVWIMNMRGTSYSTNHTYLKPEDPRFWAYSFQQIGLYDMPATIDTIRDVTGFDKVSVVGWSLGNIVMNVLEATIPEYRRNLDLVIQLAPPTFLANHGFFAKLPSIVSLTITGLNDGPFPPQSGLFFGATAVTCDNPLTKPICGNLVQGLFGFNKKQLNYTRLGVYLSQFDRTSVMNLRHIFQAVASDQIGYYSYEPAENIALYGVAVAPPLPYENIDPCDRVVISALNDGAVDARNTQKYRNSFKFRPKTDHIVEDPEYSHGDFVMAIENYQYVNRIVLDELMERGYPVTCDKQ